MYSLAFLVDKVTRYDDLGPSHSLPLDTDLSDSCGNNPQNLNSCDRWCRYALDQKNIFTPISTVSGLDSIDSVDSIKSSFRGSCSAGGAANYLIENPRSSASHYSTNSSKDWRYGKLCVTAVDMDAFSSQTPLKSRFLGHGVVKLYRDDVDLQQPEPDTSLHAAKSTSLSHDNDGTVLAILAVPGYLTPSDLIGFVGPTHAANISHFRMVSTDRSNRYMVLIKFRTPDSAKTFQTEYNGKLFNSMEAESCHVIFVSSILFGHEVTQSDDFPYLIEDEFTRRRRASSVSTSSKPLPPPPPSLKELPTCPVCLERMDNNITGLLTILCQHTFHCQCLSKWADGSCPVCRYSQLPKVSHEAARCNVCQCERNLWICLICGHIGCSRYEQAHAVDHFVATGHCYAMDTQTQRVWDYSGDNYVHRLLQNEADGKLVVNTTSNGGGPGTVPESSSSGQPTRYKDKAKSSGDDEEDLAMQYTRLLTSQLESQRDYYEDMLRAAADHASMANERAGTAESKLSSMEQNLAAIKDQAESALKFRQELDSQKIKNEKLAGLCRSLEKSYREEKLMAEKIMAKLDTIQNDTKQKDDQINDLQDQLRDVMFFLDAREKLEQESSDVTEGQVTVGKAPAKKHGKVKRK